MEQKRKHLLLLVIACGMMTLAHAPGEQTIVLEPDRDGAKAYGEVMIKNYGQRQKEILIYTKGLKPNAVYSVWLTNTKPSRIPFMKPRINRAGLGESDYSFRSDHTGRGRYRAIVPTDEWEKWQTLRIFYHPSGDPANRQDIKSPLRADLKQPTNDHDHDTEE